MTLPLTSALWFSLALVALPVLAQDTIYRCGNEYTNDVVDAKARGCKVMLGGNVTVIQANKPAAAGANAPRTLNGASTAGQRVDSTEQRARDADARAILESEQRKAEQKLELLRRDYNDGQPEKMATEVKNYQKYLDRVTDMRTQITRLENDIAGIKREISRLGR